MSNLLQSLAETKITLLTIFVIAATISFLPVQVNAQNSTSSMPEGFSLFEDAARGYSIIYPSDAQQEDADERILFTSERDGWEFSITGPLSLEGKTLEEFVYDVHDFSEFGFGNLADDSKELEVNGSPAIMMDSSFDDLKGWKIFIQNDKDYYEIHVYAQKDRFSPYIDLFNTMLQSITFTSS
ncbi:hypothetical protein [Candidatus Nitrosocosmicus sp. T]